MGGSKGGSAPDYAGAASADQAGAAKNLTQQTWANRPTLTTPWGTQTWAAQQGIDPATGQPVTTWGSDISLSPDQQAALDAQNAIQMGRSDVAGSMLGQVADQYSQPFNWSNLPSMPGQAAQAGDVQGAQQRAYDFMSQALQPGRTQQQEALDTKMANMGLPQGSEANQRANMQLQNQWAAENRQMLGQAMQQGTSDVQAQYGMGAQQVQQQEQLRQQAIAEQAQQRGMPLNELNALLTGQQVNMPSMPGFNAAGVAQAPNQLGAAQAQGQFQLGQGQLAQQNIAGLGSLAGAGVAAAMMF
jgi:hypothetical protein